MTDEMDESRSVLRHGDTNEAKENLRSQADKKETKQTAKLGR